MDFHTIKNYELVKEQTVPELKSDGYLFKHKKTGARVLVLPNEDDNKVFYIGFRTPPCDDCGTPHILEHSVLCGSDKYPLKDPFVELVKGSLNTFLNAMTYPDKTVYPIASRNDKDFKNLMSVYMDAVFHPNIYKHPEIFHQEGWNYLAKSAEEPLEYNGVVYNEMKGVFSSPEGVLESAIMKSLFPDSVYGFESGGDPDHIPELTYEKFLDFHRKYYHPSNSYIYLYGDMDVEETLNWMDSEYLSHYDYLDVDSEIRLQPAFQEMHSIRKAYSVAEDGSEENATYLAYNVVCGDNLDTRKYYAMQMIQYALLDNQGAPIRQRLLDEGIGKDILPSFENGILQPYFSIVAKDAQTDQAGDFLQVIREELEKAIREGLNRKSLKASLNSMKFKVKEADFGGYPKGLIYGLSVFDSWLYDEMQPLLHLATEDTFRFLEENIDTGYFEGLVKEYLLDNPHATLLIMYPQKGLTAQHDAALAEKLEAFKASKSAEEIAQMVKDSEALAAYQASEETPEALQTIPLLERSDIKRDPGTFSNQERKAAGLPVLWHDYFTNGIAYVDLTFNANDTEKELLPYLGLLKSFISFVDTEHYTYSELNNEIYDVTGGLITGVSVNSNRSNPDLFALYETLSLRMLYENVDKAFDLAEEVLFTGRYEDEKRLYEIIAELKSRLQMSLNSAGHSAAVMRANSYFSKTACVREQYDGIAFYKFVEHLEKHFDEEKQTVIANLKLLIDRIFHSQNLLVSITADEEGCRKVENRLAGFAKRLKEFESSHPAIAGAPEKYYDFDGRGLTLERKNEGFKTSASIQFVARCGRYLTDPARYSAAMIVFRTIMNYDYLWLNIRVQGGAYGCMSSSSPSGECSFVTYRDPNLKRSSEIFDGIADYLEHFDVDEREMTKYVIGTMSGVDTPLTPAAKGARDLNAYLSETSWETLAEARHQIIDCRAQDIRALAPYIREAMKQDYICVIGNEQKIEEDKDLFMETVQLFD